MPTSDTTIFTPFRVVLLCTLANLLNFMDREIVAGSPNEFENFVHNTINVPVEHEGVYIGYLTSTFIVVFAISIMAFGNMVHRVAPFKLLSFGTLLWVLAVFLSGECRKQKENSSTKTRASSSHTIHQATLSSMPSYICE